MSGEVRPFACGSQFAEIPCPVCNDTFPHHSRPGKPTPPEPEGAGPERFHFEAKQLTISVPKGIVTGHRYGFTLWTHIEPDVAMIERTINLYIDKAYAAGAEAKRREIAEKINGYLNVLADEVPAIERPKEKDFDPWHADNVRDFYEALRGYADSLIGEST